MVFKAKAWARREATEASRPDARSALRGWPSRPEKGG